MRANMGDTDKIQCVNQVYSIIKSPAQDEVMK